LKEILETVTKEECAKRNTENLLEHWRFCAKSSIVTKTETDEIFQIDYGLTRDDTPFASQGIWRVNLPLDVIDEKIENVVDYFNSRNMPFLWYVCPSSKPDNLDEYLKAHSFNEMDATPIMSAELDNLIDDREKPKNLEIVESQNEDSIREFWDIWQRGYPTPKGFADRICEVFVDVGYHPENNVKLYTGYLSGKPVATSYIVMGGGVVGLYGVVTLPEARGLGIGTEMSLHPLRIARSYGYKIGVLDATQKGIGIYKRIGFKEVLTPKMFTYAAPDNVEAEKIMEDLFHTPRK
jgi:GNAT superfamily N-acetyltransferase